MAWFDITYSCGHTGREQIYGTNSHGERDRKAEWLGSRPCEACRKRMREERFAAHAEQAAEAAESNKANGCPDLCGSVKQVAWAEEIRAKAIAEVDRAAAEAVLEDPKHDSARSRRLREIIRRNDSAAWWIDNRNNNFVSLAVEDLKEELAARQSVMA